MGQATLAMETGRSNSGQLNASVYERAAQMRIGHRSRLVRNTIDRVWWRADQPGFVYQTRRDAGMEHVFVDPMARIRQPLAADEVDGMALRPAMSRFDQVSPNGQFRLERRGYDLWLVGPGEDEGTQLTTDGTMEYAYGTMRNPDPNPSTRQAAVAFWSPDGRYAVTQRVDYRGVRNVTLVESAPLGGGLPVEHRVYDAYPGDERVPEVEILIVDAETGTVTRADLPVVPSTHSSPLLRGDLWWDARNGAIFFVHSTRDWLHLTLFRIDPATGTVQALVSETGERRIRPSQFFHQRPNVRVLVDDDGEPAEVLWFSERDGWGHLYLYDAATEECLRQVTSGEFVVQEILRVDQASGTAWLSVSGLIADDPYRRTACRVNLATGEIDRLFADDLDHRQLALPDERAFIDIASTVDTPPHATLCDWDGTVILDLETADIAALEALGWRPPERFQATGADGETPIYGTIYFPLEFDPETRYPVLDHTYPGPQIHRALPNWEDDEVEPFAAVGLIGLVIDGKGTPGRSRAFHDASWANLGGGSGLDDHVAVIRELAATRSWMDIGQVGVFGHSAGGLSALRAMELFPEFYKVGIAASGRYDGRLVMPMILESYDHPTDPAVWARSSAVESAGDITGKLLLVHGEMDDNVIIQQAYRVIDRMIAANRDFDLLVVPGDDHVFSRHAGYVDRRQWDYYVRHLMGMEPPTGVVIPN